MPVIKSAKKALRREKRQTKINKRIRINLKTAVDAMTKKPVTSTLNLAYRVIDRAAKKHIIHPNKANRLKSQMAKKVVSPKITPVKKTAPKTKK